MDAKEYFEQGYEKQLLKQFAEAIECYNKVLELDKDFERAYVQRAYCNVQLNEYKTAISDYKTALELNPNDPITYLNLGQTYYYLGQKGDTTYFDKAIELDENMFEEMDKVFNMLMGTDVIIRKNFIMEHAKYAQNIDTV